MRKEQVQGDVATDEEKKETIRPRELARQILEKCGDVRVKNIIVKSSIDE